MISVLHCSGQYLSHGFIVLWGLRVWTMDRCMHMIGICLSDTMESGIAIRHDPKKGFGKALGSWVCSHFAVLSIHLWISVENGNYARQGAGCKLCLKACHNSCRTFAIMCNQATLNPISVPIQVCVTLSLCRAQSVHLALYTGFVFCWSCHWAYLHFTFCWHLVFHVIVPLLSTFLLPYP